MRKYANGLITQTNIIETCKRLFYEKGFRDTTISLLCSTANVNPGTVAHHFNNKLNLGAVIYNDIVSAYHDAVQSFFPKEDRLQQDMTALCLHIRMLFEDAAYRRFSAQFLCESAYSEDTDNLGITSAFKAVPAIHERMNEQKFRFYCAAATGIGGNIESYIDRHIDEFSFEDSARYYCEFLYMFLNGLELHMRVTRVFELIKPVKLSCKQLEIELSYIEKRAQ